MAQLNAAMQVILNPAANSSFCTATFTPRVVIRNAGTITITTLRINRQLDAATPVVFNWAGSLAPGATDTVSLAPFSAAIGSHQFTAYTYLPNNGNDVNKTNDTLRTTFSVLNNATATIPLSEGFQTATFPPLGWTLLNPNPGSDTWQRTTAAGYKSTASMVKNNFSSNDAGQVDHMVLPVLNLGDTTNNYLLTFRRAYAPYNTTLIDTLQVWVSNNCGASWTKVYNKFGTGLATKPAQGTSYVPADSSDWALDTVSLFNYRGNGTLRVRFTNASGFGNNLYIDNININSYTLLPVASFSLVKDTVCVGDTVRVVNNSIRATDYQWNMPGGTPGSSTAAEPTIIYGTSGIKTIVLTARNQFGSSQDVHDVYVLAGPSPVIYKFALQLSSPVPYPGYQWYRNGQPIPGATGQIYYALHEGVYTLEVVSPTTGCRGMSNPITITNLAVSNASLTDKVVIAPNPARGTVNISEALPGNGDAQVAFFNAVGQEVLRTAVSAGQAQIDINRLPAGAYMLRISKGDAVVTSRLLVN